MKKKTHRPCRRKACGKIIPYTLRKHCSPECERLDGVVSISKPRSPIQRSKKPISKASKKQIVRNSQYTADRIVYLGKPENKYCVIHGSNCTSLATTIEHTAGRKGFYDEWARDNNIWLLNDIRFWKPACNNCNLELENNPELSHQHQLSKIHGGAKK